MNGFIVPTKKVRRTRDDPLFDAILDLLIKTNSVKFTISDNCNHCGDDEIRFLLNNFNKLQLAEVTTNYSVGIGVTEIEIKWHDRIEVLKWEND